MKSDLQASKWEHQLETTLLELVRIPFIMNTWQMTSSHSMKLLIFSLTIVKKTMKKSVMKISQLSLMH